MHAVVTGAAGFIGSTLAESLVASGATVKGTDSFSAYYDPAIKQQNLIGLVESPAFELVEGDLETLDLESLVDGASVVFHMAAQPGVRLSWAEGFGEYARSNVVVTQRVLEACRRARIPRLVYASSSSVYGNSPSYPTTEAHLPKPHSPYGVTKLAGEHLCSLYASNYGLSTVSLRFFTVYGPRQRPDMAMHRLIEASLNGRPFPLFGTGEQVRDFTFVDDVVAAVLAAGQADVQTGAVLNVAGGTSISLTGVIALLADVVGVEIKVDRQSHQAGDVDRTGGSIELAQRVLGWHPVVDLTTGLAAQVRWHQERRLATSQA